MLSTVDPAGRQRLRVAQHSRCRRGSRPCRQAQQQRRYFPADIARQDAALSRRAATAAEWQAGKSHELHSLLNGLQRGIHAASVFLSAAARRVQRTSASAPDLLMPGHQVTAREHLVKPSGAAGSEGESPDLQLKRLDSGSWNGDLSCSKSLSQSDSLARVSSTGNAAGGPPPCSLQSAARGSPGEAVGVAGGAAGGARVTASVHGVSSDTVEKVCTILSCVPCCVLLLLRRSALDAHAQTARAHVAATRCCTAPSTGAEKVEAGQTIPRLAEAVRQQPT